MNSPQAMRAGQIGDITFGAIHKKRRNVLRGVVASQILMLQDIRRKKLGKSGSKFQHGGGGIKNGQKIPDVFYGRPPLDSSSRVLYLSGFGAP